MVSSRHRRNRRYRYGGFMVLLQIFRISITGRLNLLMITIPITIEGLEDSTREMETFFNDNLYSARATKIDYQNSVYNTVKSGMSDYLIKIQFQKTIDI